MHRIFKKCTEKLRWLSASPNISSTDVLTLSRSTASLGFMCIKCPQVHVYFREACLSLAYGVRQSSSSVPISNLVIGNIILLTRSPKGLIDIYVLKLLFQEIGMRVSEVTIASWPVQMRLGVLQAFRHFELQGKYNLREFVYDSFMASSKRLAVSEVTALFVLLVTSLSPNLDLLHLILERCLFSFHQMNEAQIRIISNNLLLLSRISPRYQEFSDLFFGKCFSNGKRLDKETLLSSFGYYYELRLLSTETPILAKAVTHLSRFSLPSLIDILRAIVTYSWNTHEGLTRFLFQLYKVIHRQPPTLSSCIDILQLHCDNHELRTIDIHQIESSMLSFAAQHAKSFTPSQSVTILRILPQLIDTPLLVKSNMREILYHLTVSLLENITLNLVNGSIVHRVNNTISGSDLLSTFGTLKLIPPSQQDILGLSHRIQKLMEFLKHFPDIWEGENKVRESINVICSVANASWRPEEVDFLLERCTKLLINSHSLNDDDMIMLLKNSSHLTEVTEFCHALWQKLSFEVTSFPTERLEKFLSAGVISDSQLISCYIKRIKNQHILSEKVIQTIISGIGSLTDNSEAILNELFECVEYFNMTQPAKAEINQCFNGPFSSLIDIYHLCSCVKSEDSRTLMQQTILGRCAIFLNSDKTTIEDLVRGARFLPEIMSRVHQVEIADIIMKRIKEWFTVIDLQKRGLLIVLLWKAKLLNYSFLEGIKESSLNHVVLKV